ncbi:hypothetical protein [Candidatus Nitrosocosmicus sp. T]
MVTSIFLNQKYGYREFYSNIRDCENISKQFALQYEEMTIEKEIIYFGHSKLFGYRPNYIKA